ncbi:MAG: CHAT domain-containing protein [Betaproteobacteria bacterium]|nr:CHAT domain-containing protein [Betaproteobacteria bacterium]
MPSPRPPSHVPAALLAVWLGVALFGCLQPQGHAQQRKTLQPPQSAREVDDRRWQQLADEAEAALAQGSFSAAERLGRDLLEEARRVFGEDHANMAASQSILGSALLRQGRYADAEIRFRQALSIHERRTGGDSVGTASALNNLALALERMGDFAGAEVLLRRAYRNLEKALGPVHPDTATTMSNLGRVLDAQGKLGAGAGVGAVPPDRAAPGEDPQQLAARAEELIAAGHLRAAETLHHRVLAIHERTLGAEHPTTATSLSNLGNVLTLQGKLTEAERVHRGTLKIREKVLGPDHPDTATSLNNLANVLMEQGRDERISPAEARARLRSGQSVVSATEVENLFRRALAIQERALGPGHPALANTLNNLGALLDQRGEHPEAEALQRRALAIAENALGPLHPDTAATLTTLAMSLDRQGKLVEAEQTYRRAVESSRAGGNPRILLLNSSRLGFALAKRGRYREALPYYREAIETLDTLYARTRGLPEETRAAFLGRYSNIYLETIKLMLALHRQNPRGGTERQILEVASRNQSRVFTEMMRQADVARFAGEEAFRALRERRAHLLGRMDTLRQALVMIPPDQPASAARRDDLAGQFTRASAELAQAESELWRNYPRFMELTNPRPVAADDLQSRLLREGEVLLSYVLLPQEAVIFAVSRERLKMVVHPAKREAIARRIHEIRRTIDKVASGESALFLRRIDPLDLNALYRDLVAPVADMIDGRAKVIVVGDGPLLTVPFEFLVTRWGAAEQGAFRTARREASGAAERPFLGEYALPAFLGKAHRFAYLPSLSALASQRLYPKPASPRRYELVGFADPEFAPGPGKAYSAATRKALEALGSSVPRRRDGSPDIPRLKETADEAKEIAAVLGGRSDLYIGDRAQERRAKEGRLNSARFVLFATHGFLGGEYVPEAAPESEPGSPLRVPQRNAAQPALALTLVGDLQGEDGLLTMKEVIEDVELNADLVALSACNTAGETAQANNGEGFAGLTRAFMFAGARSLIVSHWSVDSASTQALMTATFRHVKAGATALSALADAQRSMIAGSFNNGPYHFSRSHPFFWAPFVYVGD